MKRQLLVDYSQCWIFGHAWSYAATTWTPRIDYAIPITLRCDRCQTERRESWSIGGDMLTRSYRYPEGYSLSQRSTGTERPSREDLRAMVLADRRLRLDALAKRRQLTAVS